MQVADFGFTPDQARVAVTLGRRQGMDEERMVQAAVEFILANPCAGVPATLSPLPETGVSIVGHPTRDFDGLYQKDSHHMGWPVLKNEAGYFCYRDGASGKWRLSMYFTPESTSCNASVPSDGALPLGSHSWNCLVGDSQWAERTLTAREVRGVLICPQGHRLSSVPQVRHDTTCDVCVGSPTAHVCTGAERHYDLCTRCYAEAMGAEGPAGVEEGVPPAAAAAPAPAPAPAPSPAPRPAPAPVPQPAPATPLSPEELRAARIARFSGTS